LIRHPNWNFRLNPENPRGSKLLNLRSTGKATDEIPILFSDEQEAAPLDQIES